MSQSDAMANVVPLPNVAAVLDEVQSEDAKRAVEILTSRLSMLESRRLARLARARTYYAKTVPNYRPHAEKEKRAAERAELKQRVKQERAEERARAKEEKERAKAEEKAAKAQERAELRRQALEQKLKETSQKLALLPPAAQVDAREALRAEVIADAAKLAKSESEYKARSSRKRVESAKA